MIILASTGPVISVRRHSRAAGSGAIFQSPSRCVPRFRQKVRHLAGIDPRLASAPCLQQFLAAAFEGPVQLGHHASASAGEDGFVTGSDRGVDLHSGGQIEAHCGGSCRWVMMQCKNSIRCAEER
jgi:hypothetical protein